ncbi:hypothetical protein K443DRAFT_673907 [Laccaria amethystina LaAM-08-1]|uniref:Uncharacterized protein n=1 Tax=Laccaria amethystina LaAM-08-1 TaxID=1095629 RepID=A0A0C9XPI0_9AGAR|nr:hypothetical protein K443DRAFT_673907 [Laccaria amethystina LaAM-08-1]
MSLRQLAMTSLHSSNVPWFLLRSFSQVASSYWSGFSGELKDALSTLIHPPTLKILYLENVDNAPITPFLGIVHLTKLDLHSVSLNYFDGEQPSSLTPKGVAAPRTVIDQCVWSFPDPTHDYPTEAVFLPFMSHLRVLEMDINPSSATMFDFAILSFLTRSLCASLTSPVTLEHLKLNITFEGLGPGSGLDRYLEALTKLQQSDLHELQHVVNANARSTEFSDTI